MIRKWFSIIVLISVALTLLSIASCGDPQELVSITIQPSVETIGASNIPVSQDAGIQVQLKAYGNYIHPPVTKDITDQATWLSNTPQMFTVSSTGLLTATGELCGGAIISASVTTNSDSSGVSSSGAVVTGFMTANVVCYTSSGSGSGPALTVTFAGAGSGTVLISPLNISCSSACVYQVPSGTELTLTATPGTNSTFGSWQNCNTPPSTNPCTITMEENTTVTVTFN